MYASARNPSPRQAILLAVEIRAQTAFSKDLLSLADVLIVDNCTASEHNRSRTI